MKNRIGWLRPVLPAGAILFVLLLALLAAPAAHAEDNVVAVDPSGVQLAPGGSVTVGILDDPPAQTLAAWVIELTFDPTIITTTNPDCISISTPGGAVGAFDCEVTDDDKDGTAETVKILGAVLFSRSEKGLDQTSTLANITFHAVGNTTTCTDLHLRILIHADSDGAETGARVQDGRLCVNAAAPPSGTSSPFPATPRTNEPTPTKGPNQTPPRIDASGNTQPATTSKPTPTPRQTTKATTNASGQPTVVTTLIPVPAESGGGGGSSALIWVVVGAVVLLIAGVGAWGLVRMRAREDSGPPPPPAAPET